MENNIGNIEQRLFKITKELSDRRTNISKICIQERSENNLEKAKKAKKAEKYLEKANNSIIEGKRLLAIAQQFISEYKNGKKYKTNNGGKDE